MGALDNFTATLADLSNKLFGKRINPKGLKPGDRGYLQEVFDVPIDEAKIRPKAHEPVGGQRYDEIQRRKKISRKGQRQTKRHRHEGPRK